MTDRSARSSAWADPGPEAVRELLRRSSDLGWREALEEVAEDEPVFVERMRNQALGNWQLLLAPHERPAVLDVGCGFGTLTLGSSRFARRAVGIDPLPERIRYGSLRARQSDAPDTFFTVADGFDTPFPEDAFDLVTLNGVLEWAGLYSDGEPVELQRRMLLEARRVTRDRGAVAVAIENRLAAETLLGLRDTHTGVHFLTALPEPLASLLLRARMGEDPRLRLHGRRGYRSLFESAGFRRTRLFNLVPSYNDYRFVLDAGDEASHRFVHDRLATGEFYGPAKRFRRLLARHLPGALPGLAYAYLVVGREGGGTESLLEAEASLWRELGVPSHLQRFGVQMDRPGAMGVLLHENGRPRMFLKCWSERVGEPALPAALSRDLDGGLEERSRGAYGHLELALLELGAPGPDAPRAPSRGDADLTSPGR